MTENTPLLPSPTVKRVPAQPYSSAPYTAVPAAVPALERVESRLHGLVGLDRPASTWNELRVLVKSSIPLSIGLMLENALNTINILIVGRLGPSELAVAGNSSLLIMVTGKCLLLFSDRRLSPPAGARSGIHDPLSTTVYPARGAASYWTYPPAYRHAHIHNMCARHGLLVEYLAYPPSPQAAPRARSWHEAVSVWSVITDGEVPSRRLAPPPRSRSRRVHEGVSTSTRYVTQLPS